MKSLCLPRFLSYYIVLLHLLLIDIIGLSVVTNRWLTNRWLLLTVGTISFQAIYFKLFEKLKFTIF